MSEGARTTPPISELIFRQQRLVEALQANALDNCGKLPLSGITLFRDYTQSVAVAIDKLATLLAIEANERAGNNRPKEG